MKNAETLVRLIKQCKNSGRTVFVCGNGGSAASAEHFSCDLLTKWVKNVCLNSNVSAITMIGNDFGYEHIFSRQLMVLGTKDDLLITISCSGVSPNILKVIEFAKSIGINIFSFPPFDKDHDYEKLEDEHLQLIHQVKKLL